MKICPRCNAQNYDQNQVCFHCGLSFIQSQPVNNYASINQSVMENQETAKPKKPIVLIVYAVIFTILFYIALVANITGSDERTRLRNVVETYDAVFYSNVEEIVRQKKTIIAYQNDSKVSYEEIEPTMTVSPLISLPVINASAKKVFTDPGSYLVPNEMPYGNWSFQSSDPNEGCPVRTYSSLNPDFDSMIDIITTDNKGYFVLSQSVKMAELTEYWDVSCTWTWLGE
ncbi:MAG: hypothetical protein AB9907_14885 [Flexilinea sp.]